MSASSCIIYFGQSYFVSPDEVEGLELRLDHRIRYSKLQGLDYYWGNIGVKEEDYRMLVGRKIAILGNENDKE
jgi:hypothetical protein